MKNEDKVRGRVPAEDSSSLPAVAATTHSHSGRRPSWARISRIARPVCSVSSSARAGTRSSNACARRVRTFDRWTAGARDHAPDSNAAWASATACWTSSELAVSTLQAPGDHGTGGDRVGNCEHFFASIDPERGRALFAYVQMCRPVAGFVTESLNG
jgi:hypothetical protein